jgi:hypothetical protein
MAVVAQWPRSRREKSLYEKLSSGALRAAAARPSSVAEPRTAGAPASQRFPAARPHRPLLRGRLPERDPTERGRTA